MIGPLCHNTAQLCKCLIYENRAAPMYSTEFEFARFYCLIYQYERRFSQSKFATLMKHLAWSKHPQLTKTDFKWKFAEPNDAVLLANSEFNGMSFLGFH